MKHTRRQRTISVGDHKITVVTTAKTWVRNFVGFRAVVRDNRGNELKIDHLDVLERNVAEDIAFARFVERFC